jgi:hypothetical protein
MLFEHSERKPAKPKEPSLDLFDRHLLKKEMGLTETECVSLREAAMRMEQWRKHQ